ncbi:MAG: hypothetical protein IJB75_08245 [Oscillospiraceae bacterium]|nr:hypothetical protein [Oscillospiraceae bacterium]
MKRSQIHIFPHNDGYLLTFVDEDAFVSDLSDNCSLRGFFIKDHEPDAQQLVIHMEDGKPVRVHSISIEE